MRIILLGLLFVCACSGVKVGPFQHNPEQPTAPDPWHSDDPDMQNELNARRDVIVAACAAFAHKGCPEAKGTADGMSCEETLRRTEMARPQHFTFGPECVVRAPDCSAASACAHPIP